MWANRFIIVLMALFVALLSLITLAFRLHRIPFYLELLFIAAMGIVAAASLFGAYFEEKWAANALSIIWVLMIADFLLLRFRYNTVVLPWIGILSCAVGFAASSYVRQRQSVREFAGEKPKAPAERGEPVAEFKTAILPPKKPAVKKRKK